MSAPKQPPQNMGLRVALFVILCFAAYFILFKSFNDHSGYWETEIGHSGSHLALTIRRAGMKSDNQSRKIVFKEIDVSTIKPGIFKLPDEAEEMSGIKMTFQDITLRPGLVMLKLNDHEIGIMVSKITIDDVSYAWDQPESIEISN